MIMIPDHDANDHDSLFVAALGRAACAAVEKFVAQGGMASAMMVCLMWIAWRNWALLLVRRWKHVKEITLKKWNKTKATMMACKELMESFLVASISGRSSSNFTRQPIQHELVCTDCK